MVPRVEAIPHLQRAIELDPNFAMAQALLSGVYANTGRSAEAPVFSRRAFELRDRVSERERFFISWRYYLDAAQAWDKALELALSWTTTYPREAFAFNSLGLASAAFGQHEQAVAAFREAIRLDPRFVPPHGNLAGSLIALNRFDEAKALLDEAAARGYRVHRASGDGVPAGVSRKRRGRRWRANWIACAHSPRGDVGIRTGRRGRPPSRDDSQAAHELFQRGVAGGRRATNFHELAAQWTMEDAELHAIAGECDEARREIAAGLELEPRQLHARAREPRLALCGAAAKRRACRRAGTRFPSATLTARIQLPVIAAAARAAAARTRARARAAGSGQAVRSRAGGGVLAAYLRGQAYLR